MTTQPSTPEDSEEVLAKVASQVAQAVPAPWPSMYGNTMA